jgi:hypothetical protein
LAVSDLFSSGDRDDAAGAAVETEHLAFADTVPSRRDVVIADALV